MLLVTQYPFERSVEPLPPEPEQTHAEELSARLARLQAQAWEDFYLSHRRLIRGVLAGCLGYTSDLEDTTQQVFERALELVVSGKVQLSGQDSGMRAWLVAIALRLAREEQRRRIKANRSDAVQQVDSIATPAPDPAGWQLLQRTQAVLAKMPHRLRIPWLLRHLERMSLEEIVASTGVSLATVKRRLNQANLRFRKLAERDSVLREHLVEGGAS
jgi:RNA polymerase sigma-70 factor, ECF subfamily